MNIPKENIGSANSQVREDSTPANGNIGIVEELNNALKNCKDVKFV